jgi:hypothetical protein
MQMASMKERTARQSDPGTGNPARTQMIRRVPDFATSGWVVEANLADAGKPPDRRFFAVGLAAADDAVEAVLACPGLTRQDKRIALRPLSLEEISRLKLRARAIRPYGWSVNG